MCSGTMQLDANFVSFGEDMDIMDLHRVVVDEGLL